MLDRRGLLFGLPLLGAAAAAVAMTPRNRLNLLGDRKIEDYIPLEIGHWVVTPSNALVLPPPQKGTLSAELYSQQVGRLYVSERDVPVMMVIAYGDTQSDSLQLHRPEVCYAAVGFEIKESRRVEIPIAPDAVVPARALFARSNDREEPLVYWTRIGDFLPVSGTDQRVMRLRTEMQGYLADGVLVRLSTVGAPTPENFDALSRFGAAMLNAADPEVLPALIGRPLAAAVGAS